MSKTKYHVFDWDIDGGDEWHSTVGEAEKAYYRMKTDGATRPMVMEQIGTEDGEVILSPNLEV